MRRARFFVVFAVVTAAAIGACDLNPQPIPPGDEPDGSNSDFGAGAGLNGDASTNNPTPDDAGTQRLDGAIPPGDDAGDASSEDASDAEADADAM